MKSVMWNTFCWGMVCLLASVASAQAGPGPISEATSACIDCHSTVTPGIVADWEKSLHASSTVKGALEKPELEREVSVKTAPAGMGDVVVGCAECHVVNGSEHPDTFEHNGFQVHVVVTPKDCAVCHPTETEQYDRNIMSHAYGNLMNNSVYHSLVDAADSLQTFDGKTLSDGPRDQVEEEDSCLYCHGTVVEKIGMKTRQTSMGDMSFPVLSGWPNQGVGRVNPDGSKGACTSCHPRHGFSIAVARKPSTCGECHKGPDVPAYKVYMVSKHGNLYASLEEKWDFDAVPWVVGRDFTAPTCAMCHVSLVTTQDGEIVGARTHQMNDRNAWRIFGLIYAHPHPKSPDTTIIRNKAGLPLPTELTGQPVMEYLIDKQEMAKRTDTMKKICAACHSSQWTDNFFVRYEHTIETTNAMTLTATKIIMTAWDKGAAKGLAQHDSIFNETIERMWVENWLFFGNSVRFASAMGGADYGVFANGRWYQAKNVREMADWLSFKLSTLK